jgi:lysophospholipase L1-like esterase
MITTQYHSEFGWDNVPSFRGKDQKIQYTHNSQGYRSEEVQKGKKQIIFIGDSVTYGSGAKDEDIFSFELSQKITEFQILNLGVNAYGLDQSYIRLEKIIDQLNPKLIIVLIFSGNDLSELSVDSHWGKSKPYFTIDRTKPIYKINTQALLSGNFNLKTTKTIDPNSLRLNQNHISQFSCMNLLSRGEWQWSLFAIKLRDQFCKVAPTLSKLDQELVMKGILLKFKNLAQIKKAKIIFGLTPYIKDFKYNSLREFKGILKKIKTLPLETQEKKLDSISFQNYRNIRHFSYLSFLAFQKAITELNLPTINFYNIIKEKNWHPKELFIDGVHLNAEGHDKYTEVFFKTIQKELCPTLKPKPAFCQNTI